MSKGAKVIVAAVIVAVVGLGAFLLAAGNDRDKQTTEQSSKSSQSQSEASTEEVAATITYDGSSFSLSKNTVAVGSKVKVVNNSQATLDFDSNPHPVHTDNPELNVGDIAAGESKTFTLTTKGTWGFHNHLQSSQHGEITVE